MLPYTIQCSDANWLLLISLLSPTSNNNKTPLTAHLPYRVRSPVQCRSSQLGHEKMPVPAATAAKQSTPKTTIENLDEHPVGHRPSAGRAGTDSAYPHR